MNKIKVIADNKIPFLKGVLEPFADIKYLPPSEINSNTIKGTDALLIRTRTKCNADLLDGSDIKFIGTATIGYDHIDTAYCDSKKIKWINAPGCNSSSVMQYFASALVSITERKNLKLNEMSIGIVGVGNVGSKVAKVAKLFDMKIFLNDPPRARVEGNNQFVELGEIINNCDVITFHVPLNKDGVDKTYHLADENFFSKFKRTKIFFNTSRGAVVKASALKYAIKNKIISATVLDVWENEPAIDKELLNLVDIATPHIAGYSADGKANGTAICVREINKFFNLGMDNNWYPAEIPSPRNNREIIIKCKGKTNQEIISEAVLATYDVMNDDKALRDSVETFEMQRGNYPVRREFPFYKIELISGSIEIENILSQFGFNV